MDACTVKQEGVFGRPCLKLSDQRTHASRRAFLGCKCSAGFFRSGGAPWYRDEVQDGCATVRAKLFGFPKVEHFSRRLRLGDEEVRQGYLSSTGNQCGDPECRLYLQDVLGVTFGCCTVEAMHIVAVHVHAARHD